MGKYCSYPGCRTGRDASRAKCARLGVRQLSVFKVPKNMLQRWSEKIGKCLSHTDFVCELHFFDDSIIKEDRIKMPDGTIEVIPHTRYSLSADAVPIAAHDKGNVGPPEQNVPCNELPGTSDGLIAICNDAVLQQMPTTSDNFLTPTEKQVTSHNNEVSQMGDELIGFGDHLLESSSGRSSTCSEVDGVRDVPIGFSSNMEISFSDSAASNNREDGVENLPPQFTIDDVFAHLTRTCLPESWSWVTNPREESSIVYVQTDRKTLQARLHLILHNDLSVTAQTPDGAVTIELDGIMVSIEDVTELLCKVEERMVCCGSGLGRERRAVNCTGFIENSAYTNIVRSPRCTACQRLRKAQQTSENHRRTSMSTRYARTQHAARLKQRNYRRLLKKTRDLKREVRTAQEKCAVVTDAALTEAISELPLVQQEAVRACLNAAKVEVSNQRRYSLDWVYECLLMRIKNGKLYEHLRTRNILPLPSKDTFSRYIKRMNISYGFQKAVLDCLLLKAGRMELVDKRGALLVDEMSLSENVTFDRQTMTFNGFVDLGEHTSAKQKDERADHALVFMFQPFRGKWVQVLGCFLTKNSVTKQILAKLILECILLLGSSGFHTDVVVMDGAQWNRGVWQIFGIKDGQFSCEHGVLQYIAANTCPETG